MEVFADRVRSTRRNVVFSLSTPGGGGGGVLPHLHPIILPLVPCPFWGSTPSPSHNTSTGPMSFLGGTPSPSHNTSTGPISFLGEVLQRLVPGQDRGYPPARVGTPLAMVGHPSQGRYPPAKVGTHQPGQAPPSPQARVVTPPGQGSYPPPPP